MRAIHAASRYTWSSLGGWVASRLTPVLKRQSHLCFSPTEFVKKVYNVVVRESDTLLHWDIDEFYMTGKLKLYSFHSSFVVPKDEHKLVSDYRVLTGTSIH